MANKCTHLLLHLWPPVWYSFIFVISPHVLKSRALVEYWSTLIFLQVPTKNPSQQPNRKTYMDTENRLTHLSTSSLANFLFAVVSSSDLDKNIMT